MGGTVAQFEEAQQFEKVSEELAEVKFFIDIPEQSNVELFNADILYKRISRQVSNQLTLIGIKNVEVFAGGKGGGGLQSIKDIIKAFLENKNIIKLITSLAFIAKTAYINYLNNRIKDLKPRILISCWIESSSPTDKLSKDNLNSLLPNKLANLSFVMDGIAKSIAEEYKYLCCDLNISGRLTSSKYEVSFEISHELRTEHNIARLVNIIKDLKVIEDYSGIYNFTKWYAIRRVDNFDNSLTTYYLLISSKVIKDHFHK